MLDKVVTAMAYALSIACAVILVLGCVATLLDRLLGNRQFFRRGGGTRAEARRIRRGAGLPVEELAQRLDVPVEALREVRPRYRKITIPKRRGGQRVLHVPDDATKALQRRILRRLLTRLRAHPAACGYEKGRSIADHARPHVGRAVIVKTDIVDFFGATLAARVEAYFRRIGWDAEAARLLTQLTTVDRGLPQGAPTSPRLSNLVNFYLDVQLTSLAARHQGVYTRYADDIVFSFPEDRPNKMRHIVWRTMRYLNHKGYRLHWGKTLILRPHQRQIVTGLVVNARLNVPRATRRKLRAVEHRLAQGRPATLDRAQLDGWKAYLRMLRETD